MSKLFQKYEAIIKSGTIKEGEILGLKKALNGYANTSLNLTEREKLLDMLWEAELKLTPEQNLKGWNWLKDQWKTPKGVERKNNPFGYREEDVLEHFSHFTLAGLHDLANFTQVGMGFHNFVPLYNVVAKDGSSFQYYVQKGSGYNGGSVSIIG